MTQKLMMNTITRLTGQLTKTILLSMGVLLILGCPTEDSEVYGYTFHNKTTSPLEIHIGVDEDNPNFIGKDIVKLPPDSLIRIVGNFELDEKINPIEKLLTSSYNRFTKLAKVYRNDSLFITWHGPAYYGETENHFFNINAWKIDDDYEFGINIGRIIFTIYPEDLEQGNPP